jgi:glutathione S-transferase
MTYDLFIGDRTFSSWSLRGWLMMEKFNLPFRTHMVGLYSGTMAADLADLAPARLVPTMRMEDGVVVGESLAMAETLAEAHPDAGMWPADRAARATARWLCAEMVGCFSSLRSSCPMQLQHVNVGFSADANVLANLDRVQTLWVHAQQFRTEGPWLFGAYSLADVFYAPVCARIIGYDLPVSDEARAYCLMTVRDQAFKTWRAEGLKTVYDPFPYDIGLQTTDWPV